MTDQPNEGCQCEEALAKLEEYLDSEVGALDADRLREHLDHCTSCYGEAELEQRLRAVLRRSCFETAPETLRVRVRTSITILRSGTVRHG